MTKEECIKNAYGVWWEKLPTDVQNYALANNGLIDCSQWVQYCFGLDFDRVGFSYRRPIILKGIENNNGWIKIESEADLPKDNYGTYHVISRNNIFINKPKNQNTDDYWLNDNQKKTYWLKEYSHYQPIQKPNPPLY